MDKIMVGIAEGKIAKKTQVLASYALDPAWRSACTIPRIR